MTTNHSRGSKHPFSKQYMYKGTKKAHLQNCDCTFSFVDFALVQLPKFNMVQKKWVGPLWNINIDTVQYIVSIIIIIIGVSISTNTCQQVISCIMKNPLMGHYLAFQRRLFFYIIFYSGEWLQCYLADVGIFTTEGWFGW